MTQFSTVPLQTDKCRLVTTLPRAVAPWRPHLLTGLQLARADSSSWPAFSRYRPDEITKTTLRLTPEELDGITYAGKLFGQMIKVLLLDLGILDARRLAKKYPSLSAVTDAGGRTQRRWQLDLAALRDTTEACELLHVHGVPQLKKAVPHPLPELRQKCLVLPVGANRVITAALQCAANSGLAPIHKN